MTLASLLLVCLAACLHAGWNLLAKRAAGVCAVDTHSGADAMTPALGLIDQHAECAGSVICL